MLGGCLSQVTRARQAPRLPHPRRTWWLAIEVGPSRAATADARVLVPSSTPVRMSTALLALSSGPYCCPALARSSRGGGHSPSCSRRRHSMAAYSAAARPSEAAVETAAPVRPQCRWNMSSGSSARCTKLVARVMASGERMSARPRKAPWPTVVSSTAGAASARICR
jgi:hypothetical protein